MMLWAVSSIVATTALAAVDATFESESTHIPATQLMTVYKFDGPMRIPYYDVKRFVREGPKHAAGGLTQGTAVIPCVVVQRGKPLTDRTGTPYVGFEVVLDPADATVVDAHKLDSVDEERQTLRVKNHHCKPGTRYVIDARRLIAYHAAPYLPPQPASSGAATAATSTSATSERDAIVRAFHNSRACQAVDEKLIQRRERLSRGWDRFVKANRGKWPSKLLSQARDLDYVMRTALFEGHLQRGCTAYGACERNIIALSIRNRARGRCIVQQGCQFVGDFEGVASSVTQYNIWDEYVTQISAITSCFLREEVQDDTQSAKLEAMYTQNVADVESILFGDDGKLSEVFPASSQAELTSLRHYYHPPAMGKCFPDYERVEYVSGAVAARGHDYALLINMRIQVDDKVTGGYRFKEFVFEPEPTRDAVSIVDNYPGFVVDGRKVSLQRPTHCTPYGTPVSCSFEEDVGRHRKTPSWLSEGEPLALECQVNATGPKCDHEPTNERVAVGGACDAQMQPIAGVH